MLSVVVHDLDLMRTVDLPHETDTPLIINSDAVLARAIADEQFKAVARRCTKVQKVQHCFQLIELSKSDYLRIAPQPASSAGK